LFPNLVFLNKLIEGVHLFILCHLITVRSYISKPYCSKWNVYLPSAPGSSSTSKSHPGKISPLKIRVQDPAHHFKLQSFSQYGGNPIKLFIEQVIEPRPQLPCLSCKQVHNFFILIRVVNVYTLPSVTTHNASSLSY